MGLFKWVGLPNIFSAALPVHGQPKSLHLPLLIVHSDELPHPAWASNRLGIECNCPGDKRNSKSHQLPEGHYVKIHRTVLISDSQTCLCLCSRPSPTLDHSTSLIVSRVQDLWDPHLENLYFAPGETFHNNVDLLMRYQPHLKSLLSKEFYRPSFLLPEIQDRVIIKVTNMRKQSEEALPHLCAQQQVWALIKGSRLGPNRLSKPQASTQTFRSGLHSKGTWGLQRKEKCLSPGDGGATCFMCGTAPLQEA